MTQHSSDGTLRTIVIIVAVVLLLPFLMMAFFMPVMWGMGGFGGSMIDTGMTGGWGVWGGGMMLVWFIVLLGIGYLVYRTVSETETTTTDPALEELRMQYAQGELTDEEFEERRSRLTRNE